MEVSGKLPSNGYPVFEREMDAPTDECISTKGQAQRDGYSIELLRVRCFSGEGRTPVTDVGKIWIG